jgi:hypothetical protein
MVLNDRWFMTDGRWLINNGRWLMDVAKMLISHIDGSKTEKSAFPKHGVNRKVVDNHLINMSEKYILAHIDCGQIEKWPQNGSCSLMWTQNGQKQGDRIFFRPWCLHKKSKEWSNSSKYEILAKTNEAFSRKWRKTVKNPYFGDKMLNYFDTHFFFKNRASSLLYT